MLDRLREALALYQRDGEDWSAALYSLLREAAAEGLPTVDLAIAAREGERTDDQAAEDAGKARATHARATGLPPSPDPVE